MHVHLHILQVKFDSRLKLNFICFWLIIIKCNKYREKKLKTNPQKKYIYLSGLSHTSANEELSWDSREQASFQTWQRLTQPQD